MPARVAGPGTVSADFAGRAQAGETIKKPSDSCLFGYPQGRF